MPKPRTALLLLLVLTALAYGSVAGLGFVWDDDGLIVDNALNADLSQVPTLLTSDLWAGAPRAEPSGYYRPLVTLSFAFERAAFGLRPAAFHLVSLGWHLAATLVVALLLGRVLPPWPALAGAALFALHPAQTEAVAFVAARNDPMSVALGGLALLAVDRDAGPRLLPGAVLAALAVLSKESMAFLPLLAVLWRLAAGRPVQGRAIGALAAGVGLAIGLRLLVGVGGAGLPPAANVEVAVDQGLALVGTYGAMLVAPWPLSVGRWLPILDQGPLWRLALGTAFVFAAPVLAALLPAERRRQALAGIGWMLLTMGPTVIGAVDKGVIGDRYAYAGVVGLALWAAALLPRALPPLALALAVPCVLAVQLRLPDWKDEVSLWRSTVQVTPGPTAWVELANASGVAGDMDAAAFAAMQALPAPRACAIIDQAVAIGVRPELAATAVDAARAAGCPGTPP